MSRPQVITDPCWHKKICTLQKVKRKIRPWLFILLNSDIWPPGGKRRLSERHDQGSKLATPYITLKKKQKSPPESARGNFQKRDPKVGKVDFWAVFFAWPFFAESTFQRKKSMRTPKMHVASRAEVKIEKAAVGSPRIAVLVAMSRSQLATGE